MPPLPIHRAICTLEKHGRTQVSHARDPGRGGIVSAGHSTGRLCSERLLQAGDGASGTKSSGGSVADPQECGDLSDRFLMRPITWASRSIHKG
jgi:hypothetical protein